LAPFNFFALGIIGFLVGAEIKLSTLKKYGRQFSAILFAEGVLAFILVGLSTGAVLYLISHNFNVSLAGGIVFGAIASATDPASTLNVLQEYRSAGILTTTVIAIVALDDALAMTLYGLGTGVAQMLSGSNVSTLKILFNVLFELFGSIALGLTFGYIVNYILRRSSQHESSIATSFGLLLLCIGITNQLNLDVILATMSTGILIINKAPKRSREIIEYIKNLSIPIYILFFVLVGARLQLNSLPGWLWMIIGLYIFFRTAGKYFGAALGATITHSPKVVKKYTGLSIFAQGGVAIGLSIMASHHLNNITVTEGYLLGDVIIFGIAASTFFVQIIGPPAVKLAITLAKEAGKNLTPEYILNNTIVADHMITAVETARQSTTLREVVSIFSASDLNLVPVLDDEKNLLGGITLTHLRESLSDQSAWDWLLASDILEPVSDHIQAEATLFQAVSLMEQLQTDAIPVLDSDQRFAGIITRQGINRKLKNEQLKIVD
jgi:NhaP-type Na+/H+ or K+/H+ antiporter/predicted transcriptional regulator